MSHKMFPILYETKLFYICCCWTEVTHISYKYKYVYRAKNVYTFILFLL